MDTYISLVQSYSGRDKIIRTAGYTAMLLSSVAKGNASENFVTFAKQMSTTRIVLRLFDDLPMWTATRAWSANEKDWVVKCCGNAANVASQIFLPVEHIAWAGDHKMHSLPVSSENLWGVGTALWATSLFLSIIRSLRKIYLLRKQIQHLIKQRRLECPEKSGEANETFRASIRDCSQLEIDECWNVVKNISDLILAINILPWKFLWSGKFSKTRNAWFGTISSVIGLYTLVKAQNKSKKA